MRRAGRCLPLEKGGLRGLQGAGTRHAVSLRFTCHPERMDSESPVLKHGASEQVKGR
jgi:hypothetical protein